ncbi:probable carboxylesterase 7 [Arachis ipaensis]|uniref:probable carboxylesterase 7 n=1 Tax=Arachis ipaensis TaxID=130454 RepID=UPI000A2B50DA|nr:probable carboxylesterase 7 [Arachis ipaensis]
MTFLQTWKMTINSLMILKCTLNPSSTYYILSNSSPSSNTQHTTHNNGDCTVQLLHSSEDHDHPATGLSTSSTKPFVHLHLHYSSLSQSNKHCNKQDNSHNNNGIDGTVEHLPLKQIFCPPSEDPDPATGLSTSATTPSIHLQHHCSSLYFSRHCNNQEKTRKKESGSYHGRKGGVTRVPLLPRLQRRRGTPNPNNKLPVLLFFHGSGFCASSAFTEEYSNHVAAIANEAKVLAVSVEYAKFPARSPPECYEDAWRSLQWVVSHKGGDGPEPWLNDLADLQRVFIAGSGTGGNLSHWVASLVGKTVLPRGVSVEGAILVHPFFGGIGDDDQWLFMCKEKNGPEDPRLKPTVEDLQSLGCKRVLVCVAEKDPLLVAGRNYVTALKKSGWSGSVELVENQGLGHCEHVYKPYEDSSREVLKKIASFINEKNCCC